MIAAALRSPGRWLGRWGMSAASLIGGLLTLFVFRRELPRVSWIVGVLLLLWLLAILVAQVRQGLERRGHRRLTFAADYTIQSLYHGVLLFVLPPYYASATLTSPNVVFLGLLAALAILVTFDPWYRAIVGRWAWARAGVFVVSAFAALNVALPLIGVPPFWALVVSAACAVLSLTPLIRRPSGTTWWGALRRALALAVTAAALVAAGRTLIPPVPLSIARSALAWDTATIESLEPVPTGVSARDLVRQGLVASTAINAPAGLSQRIVHVWRQNGRIVDVVPLAPVRGGRREGYRTRSRKVVFPDDATGRWCIDVTTDSGQLIGRIRFRVTP